jgi:DNA-binding CsgD family transcriptional regulator
MVELASIAVDHIPRAFGTNACGVLLADSTGMTGQTAIRGMSDPDFETYQNIWRPRDRVFTAVLERQVAVQRRQVWTDDAWRRDPIYAEFARHIELFDYMSAPLYGAQGHLLGVLNLCRPERHRPFHFDDLRLTTAMAGYLSATFARLQAEATSTQSVEPVLLTKREREVAMLAANGHSNPQISAVLQIARETVKQTLRRVYRKLDVNGRAPMAARLAELRWP